MRLDEHHDIDGRAPTRGEKVLLAMLFAVLVAVAVGEALFTIWKAARA